jgi:NAD(P)-dependent dehydrogenase (short-subunit alcohol dehydrogenase family)
MRYKRYNPGSPSGRAYVLGAREGSGNIGEAIVNRLYAKGWTVLGDDGAVGDGSRPPGGNIPTGTLYCAAKAGLAMAARTLGWELTDRGYRIHIVHPYHVPGTPMWAEVERGVMESKNWTKEQADAYARKDLKMPEELAPQDIAKVVHALLTVSALQWLSGQGLNLYGGSR